MITEIIMKKNTSAKLLKRISGNVKTLIIKDLSNDLIWEDLWKLNLSSLIELKIEENSFIGESIRKICNANLKNIKILKIISNEIGYDGAEYISKSNTLANLTYLNLNYNKIGYYGVE